ncbi:MAG: YbaK/EbsC family protein [Acidobacteriaceae bacterium]|nr:YbaK/EbsC family protein [Acidobacteriaceae bacterium]
MSVRLTQFLDEQKVSYKTIVHATTYTAQETAQMVHIKGREIAKSVIVKIDGEMVMVVVPASRQVDLEALKRVSGANAVELAAEAEFRGKFPECDTGAMPPFGNLYGMRVYVDESLTKDKEIAFNACNHNELIQMAYDDFARVARPQVVASVASAAAA